MTNYDSKSKISIVLKDEAIQDVKLELKDCIRGLGFAASTMVLASLESAIAKYSTIQNVSDDMVRRKDLEDMFNKIKVLEGIIADKDREISRLMSEADLNKPKPKSKPGKDIKTEK